MNKIVLSELFRYVKIKSNCILTSLMIAIIIFLSLINFNNIANGSNDISIRFMNNMAYTSDIKLSEFIRLIFESGLFSFFIMIPYIIFKSKLYNTKNIQNIFIETKSKPHLILSSYIVSLIYIIITVSLITILLVFINLYYGFYCDWSISLFYLLKQVLCQFAYLMILDVLIEYLESNTIVIVIHFLITSGLAYSLVGLFMDNIDMINIVELCLSYNFLFLDSILTYNILAVSISYLFFSLVFKYFRFYKGEFR